MFVWTTAAAAWELGLWEKAARLALATTERAYRCWDAREAHADRTLPGIACEYWPHHEHCSGEGYGWGAFNVHLLLRYIVGYVPGADGFTLRPNLPPAMRKGRYVTHLRHHGRPLEIVYHASESEVRVELGLYSQRLIWGEEIRFQDSAVE